MHTLLGWSRVTVLQQLRLCCGPGSCARCLTTPLPALLLLVQVGEIVGEGGEMRAEGGRDP